MPDNQETEYAGVSFDEDHGFDPIPEPELKPPTFGDAIIKSGVVSSPGDASVLIGIFVMALIAGSFYILASSIPPVPELGGDELRPGETVPQYIKAP